MKSTPHLSACSGRLSGRSGRLPARFGRILALVGAVAGASLFLSACDASPYAASVNGASITQVTLNHQLSEWSSNKTWVSSFDSANSTASGGTGVTVTGTGGAGTYSSAFVADILANMVQAEIVHQHLTSTNDLPSADEVTASRAVNEYLRSSYWDSFGTGLRQFLVTQLAEEAVLTPISTDTSEMQSAYSAIEPYLASQVCLRQASAFSKADAASIVASGYVGGSVVCYAQDQLESQSQAFQSAVTKLTKNAISSPVQTSFGYVVLQLVSRQSPGMSNGVKRVLSVAIASSSPAQITAVVDKAKVQVNPTYGTWSEGRVTPPSATSQT